MGSANEKRRFIVTSSHWLSPRRRGMVPFGDHFPDGYRSYRNSNEELCVSFDVSLNKLVNKQSIGRWIDRSWRSSDKAYWRVLWCSHHRQNAPRPTNGQTINLDNTSCVYEVLIFCNKHVDDCNPMCDLIGSVHVKLFASLALWEGNTPVHQWTPHTRSKWCVTLMFPSMLTLTRFWTNCLIAGDLRRHDVFVKASNWIWFVSDALHNQLPLPITAEGH